MLDSAGTKGAASRRDGDLAKALGTFLCRRVGAGFAPAQSRHQRIYRQHDKKINGRAYKQEAHERVDKIAERKLASVDGKDDAGKIGLAHYSGDQRRDQVLYQRGHHRAEGGAYDYGDCQVEDIASHDELLESTHFYPPARRNRATRSSAGSRIERSAA